MQKFLKDWAARRRIRVMRSKVCNAGKSRIYVGFVDVFLSTTPAVEPLAETHRFRPELNPVQVLKDVLGNGSEETWRRQGEPEGRKGLLRSEGAAASFSRARRNSLVSVSLRGRGSG